MNKVQVHYQLDPKLKSEIIKVRNEVMTYLQEAEIYLFGSIAKGCYSNTSDIDLLILLGESLDQKALRYLRHEIEDKIECCYISRQVDIKLYTRDRYKVLCQNPCFEQCIQKDLIDIKTWQV